jgi:ribosomal protein L33
MKEKGYKTGLYASLSWFYEFFQTFASRNEGYSHWIAQWAPRCTYTGTFDMWQYSSKGRVDGLNGDVDMDYYYGSINFPDAYYSDRDDGGKTVPQIPMYRLYNPLNKEHFYTMSENERDTLCMLGWDNEGIGWYAPKTSNTPVYRLYNPFLRDHHYTTSTNERDTLASIYGWTYEGIGWYSDDKKRIPVYREFNPRLTAGSHNYTTGKTEHDFLQTVGWIDEGISWYACKKG